MHLHSDPSLAAVPGFEPQRLESLTRSIEQKKKRLEDDINEYIKCRQDDLRKYERELVEQYRSMERIASPSHGVNETVSIAQSSVAKSPSSLPAEALAGPESTKLGSEEAAAKRTKHTRVHKREKELFGLVTPIFLPLLEAGNSSPVKKRKEKKRPEIERAEEGGSALPNSEQGSPSRDADVLEENRRARSKTREEQMERGEGAVVTSEAAKETPKPEPEKKKSKRSLVKKSSLRHNNAPRSRRKRVSLIIDDQIVLPAEEIVEPPLSSPSETTTSSTSNSTASLDEMLDPRLIQQHAPVHHENIHVHDHGPIHHSLPLPMSLPSTSLIQHTGHTLSESPSELPSVIDLELQQKSRKPPLEYEPPQTATRTYLDPSPPTAAFNIPRYASDAPIYADEPEIADNLEKDMIKEEQDIGSKEPEAIGFSTYVGGIHGSGLDNVNQSGSYGYPSSLGASYLESYMKSRPLSVRLAAAERGELEESKKRTLVSSDRSERRDKEKRKEYELDVETDMARGPVDDMDDEIMGSMDGF